MGSSVLVGGGSNTPVSTLTSIGDERRAEDGAGGESAGDEDGGFGEHE